MTRNRAKILHTFNFFDASFQGGDRFLVILLLLPIEFFRFFQLLHSSLQVILGTKAMGGFATLCVLLFVAYQSPAHVRQGLSCCSRRPPRERWVLGLFDTQYAPARPYLQLVRRRNAATLCVLFNGRFNLAPTLVAKLLSEIKLAKKEFR